MDWAPPQDGVVESVGINSATSSGLTITAPGALNTKGAWLELVAATARETEGFLLAFRHNGGAFGMSIDIGIGAAGSEIVLVPDYVNAAAAPSGAYFPLSIPSGSRVSARYQRANAGDSLQLACHLFSPSQQVGRKLANAATLGFTAASTVGTAISGSGTANTKGSWVEFSSALPFEVRAVMPVMNSDQATLRNFLLDIGIGAAGSEQVVVPDMQFCTSPASTNIEPACDPLIPVLIRAGERLSVRVQCDSAVTDDIIGTLMVFG